MWWSYESNYDLPENRSRRHRRNGPHVFAFGECTTTLRGLAEIVGKGESGSQYCPAAIPARDRIGPQHGRLPQGLPHLPYLSLRVDAAALLQNRMAERGQENGRCLRCSYF